MWGWGQGVAGLCQRGPGEGVCMQMPKRRGCWAGSCCRERRRVGVVWARVETVRCECAQFCACEGAEGLERACGSERV